MHLGRQITSPRTDFHIVAFAGAFAVGLGVINSMRIEGIVLLVIGAMNLRCARILRAKLDTTSPA